MANPVVSDHYLTVGSPDGLDGGIFLSDFYLLYNDYDPDGASLFVGDVLDVVGGQVFFQSGGIEFQFDQGFTGTASFSYQVYDDTEEVSVATVFMIVDLDYDPGIVNYWPFANPDEFNTNEDTPLQLQTADLTDNDRDFASETPVFVTSITNVLNGTILFDQNAQTITFKPLENFNGIAGFDYTIIDDYGDADTTHVTIVVNPVNDPLVANDDEVTTDEDIPAVIPTSFLLANDFDADGTDPSVYSVLNPVNGTVELSSDGLTVVFRPDPDFNGIASFDYEAISEGETPVLAHVTVNVLPVDDNPTAVDDSVTTSEDTPLAIAFATLLANDINPGSTPITVIGASDALHGQVIYSASSGSITYIPDPDFNGTDAFDYQISTSEGLTSTGQVIVTVLPVNDAPDILSAPNLITRLNTSVTSAITATDPDGDPFVFTFGDPPHGSIVIGTGGAYSYVPNTGYSGPDVFSVTVTDTFGATDTVNVSVLVLPDAPVRLTIARPISVPGVDQEPVTQDPSGFPGVDPGQNQPVTPTSPAPDGGDSPAVIGARFTLSMIVEPDPIHSPAGVQHLMIA